MAAIGNAFCKFAGTGCPADIWNDAVGAEIVTPFLDLDESPGTEWKDRNSVFLKVIFPGISAFSSAWFCCRKVFLIRVGENYIGSAFPEVFRRKFCSTTGNNNFCCRMFPAELAEQLDLFSDYEAQGQQFAQEEEAAEREKRRQQALLTIRKKYGKNAILKGMNLEEGATARDRNAQIGGHKA